MIFMYDFYQYKLTLKMWLQVGPIRKTIVIDNASRVGIMWWVFVKVSLFKQPFLESPFESARKCDWVEKISSQFICSTLRLSNRALKRITPTWKLRRVSEILVGKVRGKRKTLNLQTLEPKHSGLNILHFCNTYVQQWNVSCTEREMVGVLHFHEAQWSIQIIYVICKNTLLNPFGTVDADEWRHLYKLNVLLQHLVVCRISPNSSTPRLRRLSWNFNGVSWCIYALNNVIPFYGPFDFFSVNRKLLTARGEMCLQEIQEWMVFH